MNREGKGSAYSGYTADYCVLDLETTGLYIATADIIEISALRVRGGVVVSEYHQLVNPGYHIPSAATAVNHITDDMVRDAPPLDSVIEEFLEFVGQDIILGYNNAGYDMNIVYDNVISLLGKTFSNPYIDLMHAARRTLTDLADHKLETVSRHFGLDTSGEHRALKDCQLTQTCYEMLYREFGDSAFRKSSGRRKRPHTDRIPDKTEAQTWDPIPGESDPLAWDRIPNQTRALQGKHVCITGKFSYGSREKVFDLIEAAGGFIDLTIKRTTDCLIVGKQGSPYWKEGTYGTKAEKAMKFNSQGAAIEIAEEAKYFPPREKPLIFSCCSSYLACSDAGMCIHTEDSYRECLYKKNLEAGLIFYGKNKNID